MDYSTLIGTITMAGNQLRSKLQETGAAQDIYDAMDTDDAAVIVQTATAALEKAQAIPIPLQQFKSKNRAIKLKEAGNKHYVNSEYKEALICYKKSLATAPDRTEELQMAFSNISAVLLKIKAYKDSRLNIEVCKAMGCTKPLATKLEKRTHETERFIMDEMMLDVKLRSDECLGHYIKFDMKRNAELSHASEDISFLNIDGRKKVVAAREIMSGTIVAMERAYVSTQTADGTYTSCYYCHRINFMHVPCKSCKALFCSEPCMENCLEDYHRIECQAMGYLETLYAETRIKLLTRAAIKMSLKLGWEKLSDVSKEMGEKRSKKSSVKDTFDVNVPTSIVCNDDQKTVYPGKIYNGGIVCAAIVHCLAQVPDYFPSEENKRKKAIDALSRIMMHLYTTFTNDISIICSAYDLKTCIYRCGIQRNVGWFSFTSKLTHSCEPNLYVLGLDDHVALITIQRIKKGDELTISYIGHFYDTTIPRTNLQLSCWRQNKLRVTYQIDCKCQVCVNKWDVTTHSPAKNMTLHQKQVMMKFENILTGSFSNRLKVAAKGLDAMTGCLNTTEHYACFKMLRSALQICQCMYTLNKTYDAQSVDIVKNY